MCIQCIQWPQESLGLCYDPQKKGHILNFYVKNLNTRLEELSSPITYQVFYFHKGKFNCNLYSKTDSEKIILFNTNFEITYYPFS